MNLKNFQVLILQNGKQVIQSHVSPPDFEILGAILGTFRSTSDLKWFKSEILRVQKTGKRTYTGMNTFECYVDRDMCFLKHEMDEKETPIPTRIVVEYIEESISFLNRYISGQIPGIIPESKQDEWVIVPKEYVKEDFWKSKSE